jgi:hypothetical protein
MNFMTFWHEKAKYCIFRMNCTTTPSHFFLHSLAFCSATTFLCVSSHALFTGLIDLPVEAAPFVPSLSLTDSLRVVSSKAVLRNDDRE